MTAKPAQEDTTASIVDSLQSEVAPEASPLLTFLFNHARHIALLLVLFILCIGGYWIYLSKAEQRQQEESLALGKIIVIADTAQRYAALQDFLKSAPESVRREALYASMDAANQLHDLPKLHDAWKAIEAADSSMKVSARLGMSGALAEQGKYKEALAPLEEIAPTLEGQNVILVNTRIAAFAELAGDYSRAIAACDAMIASPNVGEDGKFWMQKRNELDRKAKAATSAPAQ